MDAKKPARVLSPTALACPMWTASGIMAEAIMVSEKRADSSCSAASKSRCLGWIHSYVLVPEISGVWRKRLWVFAILTCAQVGQESLKVGIVAKQLTTGCDQSVDLVVA